MIFPAKDEEHVYVRRNKAKVEKKKKLIDHTTNKKE